ncbi:uncharacterized protein LAESUDRAFT_762032 [Laetiporus sulphureus 93-53]|uniref:Uncharacterized protein n=1 Tax=Laetiporus sulphureus 93-53 TaxID=1314785 RepID=A0A165CUN8_9APHY|nr:uncharacterized protein LAESUDRAFT_762032 [Laetiporus sulphureus 93-53]KZT03461.1 hypothetical protein LAESUDRAFT_762032 [Laetiporus sulphureus 93-53]
MGSGAHSRVIPACAPCAREPRESKVESSPGAATVLGGPETTIAVRNAYRLTFGTLSNRRAHGARLPGESYPSRRLVEVSARSFAHVAHTRERVGAAFADVMRTDATCVHSRVSPHANHDQVISAYRDGFSTSSKEDHAQGQASWRNIDPYTAPHIKLNAPRFVYALRV